jgi:hypothetical protein
VMCKFIGHLGAPPVRGGTRRSGAAGARLSVKWPVISLPEIVTSRTRNLDQQLTERYVLRWNSLPGRGYILNPS